MQKLTKYCYSCYDIGFDASGLFSISDGKGTGNVIIFGINMSSFVHIGNKNSSIQAGRYWNILITKNHKKNRQKFTNIFELYQVFTCNSLCQNVRMFPNYIWLTRKINKYWDRKFWTKLSLHMFWNISIYYRSALKAFLPLPLSCTTSELHQ